MDKLFIIATIVFLELTSTAFGTSESNNVVSVDSDDLLNSANNNVQFENRDKRSATPGLVDIAQFADTSGPGKLHIVYVDDTMTRFIFEVTVYRSTPIILITLPSGVPYNKQPSLIGNTKTGDGKIVATYDVPITATDYGFWKFQKMDPYVWEVKIQAESPVSIKQQLYELGTNSPIIGHPLIGSSYRLVITLTGFSNIQSANLAFLFSRTKLSPIGMAPIVNRGNGTFEAASVKMPSEVFMIGVQGKDSSNHMFRRLDVTEIVPVTLELSVPSYTAATIREYSTFNITFVVTNLLNTSQDVDVRIEDTRGFAQAPMLLSATLSVGENFTGMFVLRAEFAGMTTMARITARQYLGSGSFSPGPAEIRNFTVIPRPTTTTQPPQTPRSTTARTDSTTQNISTMKLGSRMSVKSSSTVTSAALPSAPVTQSSQTSRISAASTESTTPIISTTTLESQTLVTASSSVASTAIPLSPRIPKSKGSLVVDVNAMNSGANPKPANGEPNQHEEKDSLLLMILSMSDTKDKSIRINANL